MKKDFYFSRKAKEHLIGAGRYKKTIFNSKEYTEMVDHGKQPLQKANFDDLLFIGTGNLREAKEVG